MTYLLDVNLLIALIDPINTHHEKTQNWFAITGRQSWATCPLTQYGRIRVVGNPRYPNFAGNAAAVAELPALFVAEPGHQFWPEDMSILDSSRFDIARLAVPGQITDSYLLALAESKSGQFATLDRRLIPDAVHNGTQALHLIR